MRTSLIVMTLILTSLSSHAKKPTRYCSSMVTRYVLDSLTEAVRHGESFKKLTSGKQNLYLTSLSDHYEAEMLDYLQSIENKENGVDGSFPKRVDLPKKVKKWIKRLHSKCASEKSIGSFVKFRDRVAPANRKGRRKNLERVVDALLKNQGAMSADLFVNVMSKVRSNIGDLLIKHPVKNKETPRKLSDNSSHKTIAELSQSANMCSSWVLKRLPGESETAGFKKAKAWFERELPSLGAGGQGKVAYGAFVGKYKDHKLSKKMLPSLFRYIVAQNVCSRLSLGYSSVEYDKNGRTRCVCQTAKDVSKAQLESSLNYNLGRPAYKVKENGEEKLRPASPPLFGSSRYDVKVIVKAGPYIDFKATQTKLKVLGISKENPELKTPQLQEWSKVVPKKQKEQANTIINQLTPKLINDGIDVIDSALNSWDKGKEHQWKGVSEEEGNKLRKSLMNAVSNKQFVIEEIRDRNDLYQALNKFREAEKKYEEKVATDEVKSLSSVAKYRLFENETVKKVDSARAYRRDIDNVYKTFLKKDRNGNILTVGSKKYGKLIKDVDAYTEIYTRAYSVAFDEQNGILAKVKGSSGSGDKELEDLIKTKDQLEKNADIFMARYAPLDNKLKEKNKTSNPKVVNPALRSKNRVFTFRKNLKRAVGDAVSEADADKRKNKTAKAVDIAKQLLKALEEGNEKLDELKLVLSAKGKNDPESNAKDAVDKAQATLKASLKLLNNISKTAETLRPEQKESLVKKHPVFNSARATLNSIQSDFKKALEQNDKDLDKAEDSSDLERQLLLKRVEIAKGIEKRVNDLNTKLVALEKDANKLHKDEGNACKDVKTFLSEIDSAFYVHVSSKGPDGAELACDGAKNGLLEVKMRRGLSCLPEGTFLCARSESSNILQEMHLAASIGMDPKTGDATVESITQYLETCRLQSTFKVDSSSSKEGENGGTKSVSTGR